MSIWWFAFGYFAAYAPYTALTKGLSKGVLGSIPPVGGNAILPLAVASSCVAMVLFISAMGWWGYARRVQVGSWQIPFPSPPLMLSGTCTAGIVMTTTLAYTFDGVSIVLVMLLMRGGLLILAPAVDAVSGRKVAWNSWVALGLSLVALVVAMSGDARWDITLGCGINILVYLACYFIRLRIMSRMAKSTDSDATVRYFVEEQMVATPLSLIMLACAALAAGPGFGDELRTGFTEVMFSPAAGVVVLIGLFSQGTGVFGGLILLDKRENAFCVPVNRASSILAGVVASFLLVAFAGQKPPPSSELWGAAIIVVAILFLSIPALLKARRT